MQVVTNLENNNCSFPVWKTVTLGRFQNHDEYIKAIESRGFYIPRVGRGVVLKTSLATEKSQANLVRVTAEDFGLHPKASLWEIRDKHKEFGLTLCRREVALALREEYLDQPQGEVLWPVTEELKAGGEIGVLSVGHEANRGVWLAFGCGTGCWAGKWRLAHLSPANQIKYVPQNVCECAWSRCKIEALFEKK
mgnify:CR=1 FL=1